MANRVFLAATLAACLGFGPAAMAGTGLTTLDEMTEVVAHAAGADTLFIFGVFGPDTTKDFNYTYTLDTTDHTWGYSLVPGQTYLGQPIAVTLTSTSYDSATSTYQWLETGLLGAQSWTGTGTITLTGDETGSLNTSIILVPEGGSYSVSGTYTAANGMSTDSLSITGPVPVPVNAAPSTDTYAEGGWTWIVDLPPFGPILPLPTKLVFNSAAGTGHFRYSAVPEPSSLCLAGTAALVGLGWCLRRRTVSVR
jgi:PEP-CTERM motif